MRLVKVLPPSADTPTMKLPSWKAIAGMFVASAIVISLVPSTPEAAARQQAATPTPPARPDLELLDYKGTKGEYGMLTITGKIRNNTGKHYSYAQATFTVYNKAGEQVGSALANVNNLEPGGTWAFRAAGSAPGGDTFKLASITGF